MSDINRNVKMSELKNMFFYTFGIVPLDYYNVVGDGLTDNRLQIQQAINDAVTNNVKYIFVPKGEYYYSNTLRDTDKVTFIGNSKDAVIEGITIMQFPDNQVPVGGVILFGGAELPTNYEEVSGITSPGGNLKYIKRVR